ncbi:MAG: tRNA (adenosine(37)-N6)-dimethylallyltransferase MiaA [Rubrivivax sp.]|nr:MAG: tRNA (adenosine(37)-N6)-dimethylallyltransferase MiaA [Rubrivivax sp.]
MTMSNAPTVILAGPTASGKTAIALGLAQHADIEIISVDSALVYRGMDIGTAKPTPAELAAVPHHLIDIIDPLESYSAARFVQDTRRLMAEIRARSRHPVLVGGTMLYIKSLLDGLDEMPPADPAVRAMLDQRAREQGWAALHNELKQVDPTTAARLPPGDTQRIQRALEVWHSTGKPLSSFHLREAVSHGPTAPPDTVLVSLEPTDRAWLHQRIALRFQQMMQAGFVDEVMALRQRGDLHLDLPSMRCVGYRQVWEALDEGLDLSNAKYLASVTERGVAATRQLAKRQITWLRGMPWRHVVACDQGDASAQAMSLLTPHLQRL